jgi:hypothetical protein
MALASAEIPLEIFHSVTGTYSLIGQSCLDGTPAAAAAAGRRRWPGVKPSA